MNVVAARQLQPSAILVSAKADGATISAGPTLMRLTQALTLCKPRGNLARGTRTRRHGVET
eukprot:3727776-Alexandrium_andersonii.AAC.1